MCAGVCSYASLRAYTATHDGRQISGAGEYEGSPTQGLCVVRESDGAVTCVGDVASTLATPAGAMTSVQLGVDIACGDTTTGDGVCWTATAETRVANASSVCTSHV